MGGKTYIRDPNGNLYVRYLYWNGNQWNWNYNWLENDWNSNNPAASLAILDHSPAAGARPKFIFVRIAYS